MISENIEIQETENLIIKKRVHRSKIAICLFVSILVISLASIFIVSRYFQNKITTGISEISLLKDSSYRFWGSQPNPQNNVYQKSYTLYDYTGPQQQIDPTKFVLSNNTNTYNYTFNYSNVTFAQGNIGTIYLLNNWNLVEQSAAKNSQIKNLNLGVIKGYYQQLYSPIQKKFPILFYQLIKSLKQQFLPTFYTQYLFEFFFKEIQLVKDTIFTSLNFPEDLQKKLIQDQDYGWGNVLTLQPWMKLSLSQYFATTAYNNIKNKFSLTENQMFKLVGPFSMMSHLTMALNGTIKGKLKSAYNYDCKGKICNDNQLVASQWTATFLTSNQLMIGVNLNKLTKDLNLTFTKNLEYSEYCKMKQFSACMGISQALPLFVGQKNLFSFQTINFIAENANNLGLVEKYLNIQGYGQSVLGYVLDYFYKQFTLEQKLSDESFTWAWMTYQNFNQNFNIYKSFLINNLISTAMFNKWADENTCQDYFQGQFQKFNVACQYQDYKIGSSLNSYFPYLKAYFFEDRQSFLEKLNMTLGQSNSFFSSENSLFYTQITIILKDFSQQFGCEGEMCTYLELVYRQWGQNSILSNLPEAYFMNKSISILDWDKNNQVFHGSNPQYTYFNNKKLGLEEVKKIFSYDNNGILGQFSLLNRLNSPDPEQIIPYLKWNLISQTFQGLFIQKTEKQYLFGYEDQYMRKQQQKNPLNGGTPWKSPIVMLVQSNNTKYNKNLQLSELSQINSGIYKKDDLRNWKQIDGRFKSGYKYELYEDQNGAIYTWIDTGKDIGGSSISGFRPNLKEGDSLNIYIQELKIAQSLKFNGIVTGNYLIYRYIFENNDEIYIGDDTLDNVYAQINPDSYLNVELLTGQTLQAQIIIDYKTKSNYLMSQSNLSIPLYKQTITFKRTDLQKYDKITGDNKQLKVCIAVFIAFACFGLVMVIILAGFVFKWSKNISTFDDQEDRQINGSVINTREKQSLITDSVFKEQ